MVAGFEVPGLEIHSEPVFVQERRAENCLPPQGSQAKLAFPLAWQRVASPSLHSHGDVCPLAFAGPGHEVVVRGRDGLGAARTQG